MVFSKRNGKSRQRKEAGKESQREEAMLKKTGDCKREIPHREESCRKCNWERISRKGGERPGRAERRVRGRKGKRRIFPPLWFSIPWRGSWRPRPKRPSLPSRGEKSHLLGPATHPSCCKFSGDSYRAPFRPAPNPPPRGRLTVAWRRFFQAQPFLMVISPQHHLPAAAAPAPSAAGGPRGPETGRREGSARATRSADRAAGRGSRGARAETGPAGSHPPPRAPPPELRGLSRRSNGETEAGAGEGGRARRELGDNKQTCLASIN